MGTISVIELLNFKYGNKFDFHPEVNDDFNKLVVGSGLENKFIKRLMVLLDMIIQLKDIDHGCRWIEHLKKYDNIYSLHVNVDSKNYRLIFSKNKKSKLFLHMFYERSGKRNTSYEKHVEIAIKRRNNN